MFFKNAPITQRRMERLIARHPPAKCPDCGKTPDLEMRHRPGYIDQYRLAGPTPLCNCRDQQWWDVATIGRLMALIKDWNATARCRAAEKRTMPCHHCKERPRIKPAGAIYKLDHHCAAWPPGREITAVDPNLVASTWDNIQVGRYMSAAAVRQAEKVEAKLFYGSTSARQCGKSASVSIDSYMDAVRRLEHLRPPPPRFARIHDEFFQLDPDWMRPGKLNFIHKTVKESIIMPTKHPVDWSGELRVSNSTHYFNGSNYHDSLTVKYLGKVEDGTRWKRIVEVSWYVGGGKDTRQIRRYDDYGQPRDRAFGEIVNRVYPDPFPRFTYSREEYQTLERKLKCAEGRERELRKAHERSAELLSQQSDRVYHLTRELKEVKEELQHLRCDYEAEHRRRELLERKLDDTEHSLRLARQDAKAAHDRGFKYARAKAGELVACSFGRRVDDVAQSVREMVNEYTD